MKKKQLVHVDNSTYSNRDKNLRSMGFKSYGDYLNSPLWRMIRAGAYKKYDNRCFLCRKPAECIHHTSYSRKTLEGYAQRFLYPLCHEHHDLVEMDENKQKRGIDESRKVFISLAEQCHEHIEAVMEEQDLRRSKKIKKRPALKKPRPHFVPAHIEARRLDQITTRAEELIRRLISHLKKGRIHRNDVSSYLSYVGGETNVKYGPLVIFFRKLCDESFTKTNNE